MRQLFIIIVSLAFACPVLADAGIDDDGFIHASIVISQPADILYSRLGHAAIRMNCPAYGLDFCFSYESEDVKEKVLTFLSGRLKMGMTAIPTLEFIRHSNDMHRGVMEYPLLLSKEQKRKLWEVLDNQIAEGMNLPYDYMARGCAYSCVKSVKASLSPPSSIVYSSWPVAFSSMTRRELVRYQLYNHPWTVWFLNFLVGTEGERDVSKEEKIVTPSDLIAVWQKATVDGHPLLSSQGSELAPYRQSEEATCWLTPVVCCICLLLFLFFCMYRNSHIHAYVLLTIQTSMGLLLFYLLAFSDLPCTSWNWLFVPFNPFLLILWKWRQTWSKSYALLLAVWLAGMLIYPHQIVDTSHYIFAICLIINYCYLNKIQIEL